MNKEIKNILDKATPYLFGDEVDKLLNYIDNLKEKNEDNRGAMMTAKEMFEMLGYEIDEISDKEILYKMKWEISSTNWVGFDLLNKNVECFVNSDSPFSPSQSFAIDIDLLKAINKQIEELGWNNE